MSDFALGAALTIDKSVLDKITEAEIRIQDLEKRVWTSSQNMKASFRDIGDKGIQYFIDKLKLAQTELSKINVPKIDFGQSINFGQVSQQATLLAESVTKASVAINQYYSATQKSNRKTEISADAERKAYIERYEMYKKMFDQIERNEKRAIRAAENEAKAQEQSAQRAIAAAKRQYAEQAKIYQQQNLKQNTTYQGALSFAESASTINRRTKAIQYLTQARAQLSTTDANYTQKLNALNSAIKRMNAENEKAVQGAKNLAQQHSNLMNTSDQLARKLALIFSVSQIQGYVNKLIQVRGEFELQNTALASILQNKDQADKLFGQITELAVRSPFTVKELTTYTKSLAAYQVQYEDLYDTTKMLADVASGLGVDMQRLILAFGQVKAANFLRGTETRQFTEAGINMLGELAKYYSELEGRIVSVAEVQERQFKRMISFSDVEQVFKRLTSSGGMFYQMQEKQADTLKGMVSNLQDSIDLMFNSIGEANDGTLKNMVSLVKSIVDNWEIFANVLNASVVGFIAYTSKTIAASVATNAFSAANLSATASAKGLNAVLAKSILMFKNLVTWIKANPFTLWATGVAFAAYTISDHMKKVQKAREEYDILSRSLQSSKNEIEGIKSKLDSANSSVVENQNIVSKLKQGTEEYKDAQEKLNKAQSEQQSVLDELKTKYPEIYDGLVKQKDGTVDMTKAQKAYNEELERTMTLNVLMRQGEGFFSDGIFQDFQDLSTSQKEYENQTRNLEASYNAAKIMIETLAKTSEKFYNQSYSDAKKVINSTDDLATKMQKLNTIAKLSDVWGTDIGSLRKVLKEATEGYSDAFRSFSSDSVKAKEEVNRLIDNILAIANVPTDDAFKGLEESAKKSAQKTAEEFINTIPTIKDKFIQEFVNQQLNVRLGFTIDFNNETTKELSAWQKRINDYIENNNLEIKPIIATDTTSAYFNNLRSELKDTQNEISKLQKASQQRGETSATNQQQIADLQEEEKQIKQLLSAFGELDEQTKKTGDNTSQIFKDRLSFFERANKEYEKLLQNYSKEEARAKVISSMLDEAQQRGVGSIFMSAQFDDKGTLDSLNKVKAMYKSLSQEMRIEFAKAFGGIQLDMDIEVRQDRIKTIQDQFSNLFGNYELSLELDKLGLDKDLMSQLFGVQVFDLSQLRKVLEPFKNELQNTLGTDGVSAWDDMNKKISEAEAKELQDRLKTYSQYLKKSVSERVAIEMEAQKKIAEVRATEEFTPEQQERIITQINQETQVKKDEQTWKEFQDSELYIKMFEDLEFASTKALDAMEEKLVQYRNSLKSLSPTELKQVTEQLEKIRDVKISRNPFAGFKDNIKDYIEYLKKAKELNSKFIESQEKETGLKKQYDMQLLINQETKKQYSNLVKNKKENSTEGLILKEKLKQQDKILDVTLKELVAQGKITQELADQIRSGESQGKNLSTRFSEYSSGLSHLGSTVTSVASSLENIFGTMDDKTADIVSSFSDIVNGLGEMSSGVSQILSGDVFNGILSVVSGFASTIGSIFNIGDKKKEREIQRQIEQVEKLQRAYEKLEQAIDDAFSIDTLEKSTDQAIANLEAQNEAYQKMIASEQDKKKTDDDRIKEWQEAIEDNEEAIQELIKDQFSKVTGGILDDVLSAASDFTDAWLESFREVGDGMGGLEDNFQEMLETMLKQQASMLITSNFLETWKKQLEKYINADDLELTADEAKKWVDSVTSSLPGLNEALENYFKAMEEAGFGLSGEDGDTMSGLSKSISSITEDQADALAAITESIRFFTSDSNAKLASILSTLTSPAPENPFLLELKAQTEQLKAMNSLWNSLSKTSTGKGKVLKVEIV